MSALRRALRTLTSLLFAVFFGWAASLQFNDPDPVLWVTLYAVAAALAAASAFWQLPHRLWGFVVVVCLLWGVSLVPGILVDAMARGRLIGTEEERELGGLVFVGGFAASWWWVSRRRRDDPATP
mgnify:CR=1 FL=1